MIGVLSEEIISCPTRTRAAEIRASSCKASSARLRSVISRETTRTRTSPVAVLNGRPVPSTQHLFVVRAHVQKSAVKRGFDNKIIGMFHQGAISLLALPACLLRPQALGF